MLKEWTAAQTVRMAIKRQMAKEGKVAQRVKVSKMRRKNERGFEKEANGNRGLRPEK